MGQGLQTSECDKVRWTRSSVFPKRTWQNFWGTRVILESPAIVKAVPQPSKGHLEKLSTGQDGVRNSVERGCQEKKGKGDVGIKHADMEKVNAQFLQEKLVLLQFLGLVKLVHLLLSLSSTGKKREVLEKQCSCT